MECRSTDGTLTTGAPAKALRLFQRFGSLDENLSGCMWREQKRGGGSLFFPYICFVQDKTATHINPAGAFFGLQPSSLLFGLVLTICHQIQ